MYDRFVINSEGSCEFHQEAVLYTRGIIRALLVNCGILSTHLTKIGRNGVNRVEGTSDKVITRAAR